MQSGLKDLLDKRRNKCIAVILSVKERECDRHLPSDVQTKLRKVVLDQINELNDLVMDVIDSLDSGEMVLNEVYLQKIDDLHTKLVVNGH